MDQASRRTTSDSPSNESKTPKQASEAPAKPKHLKVVKTSDTENLRAGDILRKERTAQGLEIADVAKKLCLKQDYITAIENMHTKVLPVGSVRGFVGSYARHLGLETREIVDQYTAECGSLSVQPIAGEANSPAPPAPQAPKETPIKTIAACLIAVVGVGLSGALFLQDDTRSADTPATEIAPSNGVRAPLLASETALANPGIEVLPIKIVALKRAWIEVRGADGTKFISRQMSANEEYKPRLEAGWTVSTDDGGAFEWRLHDTPLAALGTEGTPVYGLRIDPIARSLTEALATETAASGTSATQ